MRTVLFIALFSLIVGCNPPHPENAKRVTELGIWVDEHEVTIQDFNEFKSFFDMKILTDSVKKAAVFSLLSKKWQIAEMADFLLPDGINLADSLDPVSQVSWKDACAFCNAKNGRLPTNEEWLVFSSGDYLPGNIWEGYFPLKDEGKDGFLSTKSPVQAFKANSFGLFDIYGNVREWTLNGDSLGNYFVKGGSFLTDYNSGKFLPKYNELIPGDSISEDLGFRCVYDW